MDRIVADKSMDTPLSQSNVSLKLSEIQKRCSELMEEPGALTELTLEDDAPAADNDGDIYDGK